MKAFALVAVVAWAGTADVRGDVCSRLGVRQGSLVQRHCQLMHPPRLTTRIPGDTSHRIGDL